MWRQFNVIVVSHKVVQLFREASKAVVSMPFLIIQPLWVSLDVAVKLIYYNIIY